MRPSRELKLLGREHYSKLEAAVYKHMVPMNVGTRTIYQA